jgi:hypothetical protein
MADSLIGKTIPWAQYEKYLKFHRESIDSFVGLYNN